MSNNVKVYSDKIVYYNEEGFHHNLNGPAVKWFDGDKEWWINGKQYTESEFLLKTRQSKINKVIDKKN